MATLASVSAFAQSSMSFTGLFDRGYLATQNSAYSGSTRGLSSASGTTRFEVRGTEDLGGGNKANFFIETDWNPLAGGTPTAAGSTSITALGGFANSESWLSFQTGSGTLKLGAPNNEIFALVVGVGQPGFSTGVGSIYSSNFSIANGIGTGSAAGNGGTATYVANTSAAINTGARNVRQDNTIKFESTVYNGFSAAVEYAPKNDYVSTTAAGVTSAKGNVGAMGYGLKYTNGPLNVGYASLAYDVGAYATGTTAITEPTLAIKTALANQTQTNTYLAANYQVLPALKLTIGLGTNKSTDGTTVNSSSTNYGAQYTMGLIDLMYQFAKKDDKSTANQDQKMTALGANYNFSKMTYGYYRYDKINYSMNAALVGADQTRNAIGFAVKF